MFSTLCFIEASKREGLDLKPTSCTGFNDGVPSVSYLTKINLKAYISEEVKHIFIFNPYNVNTV